MSKKKKSPERTLSEQTTEEIAAELTAAQPWLHQNVIDQQAELQAIATFHRSAIKALCDGSAKPDEAKVIWDSYYPRGNGSAALLQARRKRFGRILIARGLLTPERLAELEKTHGDV